MLIDLLKKRCSVRSFTDQPVSEDIISYILEAGRLSPSGGNEQSWMFGVVTDKPLITELAKCAYNQTWIATAPLIIVLVTVIVDDERDGRHIHKSRFPHQRLSMPIYLWKSTRPKFPALTWSWPPWNTESTQPGYPILK